ncbi:MAG: hypothetical protein JNL67_04255 [Planctomycetaceae bacterium]|nr:hypothetical protein [Planctomycetaceae bacterium]
MKQRVKRVAILVCVLIVGSILTLVITFYQGKPQPSVDYVALLNQPAVEAPDEEKAWAVYRDLWIKHGFSEGGKFDIMKFYLRDEFRGDVRLLRPGDGDQWQAATQELSGIEDLLEGFRMGGVRPYFGAPLKIDFADYAPKDFQAIHPRGTPDIGKTMQRDLLETMVATLLPHFQVMRHAARLLEMDTRWALEQGDLERATRNIEAMLGISVQAAEGKSLVCIFIGYALHHQALDTLAECLEAGNPFDEQQLERIQVAIAKVPVQDLFTIAGEQAMFMDVLQKTHTDNGSGDGRITADGIRFMEDVSAYTVGDYDSKKTWSFQKQLRRTMAPVSMLVLPSRKQLAEKATELYDRLEEFIRLHADRAEVVKLEQELKTLPGGYSLLQILFPAVLPVYDSTIRVQTHSNAMLAVVAVIRYQRQHGHLPKTLDELVGEFLTEVPLDPLNRLPLRYQIKGEGFVIYSVGVNQTDDGGQAVLVDVDGNGNVVTDQTEAESSELQRRPIPVQQYQLGRDYPGDWILWPRSGSKAE